MFFILQMGPHCLPRSEYTFVQGCPLWGHESLQGGASLVESNLQKLSLPVATAGKDKQGVSAVTSFDEETVSLSRSHKPVSGRGRIQTAADWSCLAVSGLWFFFPTVPLAWLRSSFYPWTKQGQYFCLLNSWVFGDRIF